MVFYPVSAAARKQQQKYTCMCWQMLHHMQVCAGAVASTLTFLMLCVTWSWQEMSSDDRREQQQQQQQQ
jgi:choline-glycine betaine transporter